MGQPFHLAAGRQIRLSSLDQDEAGHWRQLTEIIRALTYLSTTQDLLEFFLSATLELLDSDCGHVRMLDKASGEWVLRAQHGFDGVPEQDIAALCAAPPVSQALRGRGRVVIENIDNSALKGLQGIRDAGCRALQVTPLIDDSGRVLGVLTTYNDTPHAPTALQLRLLDVLCLQVVALFERTQEREQLLGAERRKDDFLATLAHELRNSIAPLRSSLEILKLAPLADPLSDRARAILDRRLHHTTRLVDDLMDASRIACGKLKLQSQQVKLAGILESTLETVAPVIGELEHTLTTELPDRDVTVQGDPMRLAQVFVNLLHNAAKYTRRGGTIHLGSRRRAGGVEIEIRDNGIGITADALPHIFEIFSQAPAAVDHRGGGLGIGLAIVKGIVEKHGGSVRVRSAGRDQGSNFTVWLPVVTPEDGRPAVSDVALPRKAPEGPAQHGPAQPQSLRVLVVDDDIDAAESLASLLAMHGHETRTAHDGFEAIEITRSYYPDLILLDLMMPRMGGIETAEHIRELPLPRQPEIIEVSAAPSPADSTREAAAGISAHLLKPVEFATLEVVMQTAARNLRAVRETGVQFLINNIDLALTLLSHAKSSNDQAKRARSLGNARRAYERANALLRRLRLDPEQIEAIETPLQQLNAELSAESE